MSKKSIEIFEYCENNYFNKVNDNNFFINVNTEYDSSSDINFSHLMDFLSKLNYSSVDSGLLPPGVKFIMPGVVIFERPPTMKLIQYIDQNVETIQIHESYEDQDNEDEDEDEEQSHADMSVNSYYIPVPWQLYIATYSTNPSSMYYLTSVNMFFMNTPLLTQDTVLYAPYIYNFFTNGNLCSPMFSDYEEIDRYEKNISGVIASSYDWVWNTGFNKDLIDCVSQTHLKVKNPIIQASRKELNYSHDYSSFFSALSKYTPDQVVQYEWLNPSFGVWYNHQDISYIYNHRQDIVERFLEENEEYDFSSVQEFIDSDQSEYFVEWYSYQVNNKKTYKDMILKMFFHKYPFDKQDYSHLLNNNSNIDLINRFYSYTLSVSPS